MIYKLQLEQLVYRFKAKTLISLCTNDSIQTTSFSIDNNNFLILKATYTTILS